jgi:hypothetical protein
MKIKHNLHRWKASFIKFFIIIFFLHTYRIFIIGILTKMKHMHFFDFGRYLHNDTDN